MVDVGRLAAAAVPGAPPYFMKAVMLASCDSMRSMRSLRDMYVRR